MSENINGIPVISEEKPRSCEFCGALAECRPYGPGGRDICFECSQRDYKDVVTHNMHIILFGEPGELK